MPDEEPPDVLQTVTYGSRSAGRPAKPRSRSRRIAVTAVVAGAALALIAGLPRWVVQHYGSDGAQELHRTGNQVAPSLLPLALVALAGLLAAFAVRGWASRVLGVVLIAAGAGIVAVPISVWVSPPADATAGDAGLPAAKELMGPVQVQSWPLVLAVLGGIVVVVGGVALLLAPARTAIGRRYDAPTGGKPTTGGLPDDQRPKTVQDADSAVDWWKSLDAGADPTAVEPEPSAATFPSTDAPIPDGVNPAVRRQLP